MNIAPIEFTLVMMKSICYIYSKTDKFVQWGYNVAYIFLPTTDTLHYNTAHATSQFQYTVEATKIHCKTSDLFLDEFHRFIISLSRQLKKE